MQSVPLSRLPSIQYASPFLHPSSLHFDAEYIDKLLSVQTPNTPYIGCLSLLPILKILLLANAVLCGRLGVGVVTTKNIALVSEWLDNSDRIFLRPTPFQPYNRLINMEDITEQVDQPAVPTHVHPQYNFEDGNILLAATGRLYDASNFMTHDDTKPVTRYLFRVHVSILKTHSATFGDMLAIPQKQGEGNPEETYDGLPLVALQDDPGDLERLLQVMYYGDAIPSEPLRMKTFAFLSTVVTLADKYDMPRLTAQFLPRIQAEWPVSLYKWDGVQAAIKTFLEHSLANLGECYPDRHLVDPVYVIRFATDLGLTELLPTAYYALSRIPVRPDDEDDSLGLLTRFYYGHGGRSANYSLLTTEELLPVKTRQDRIRPWTKWLAESNSALRHFGARKHSVLGLGVEEEKRCITLPGWWNQEVKPQLLALLGEEDLDVLGGIDQLKCPFVDLCPDCREIVPYILRNAREEFWKKLPWFFGLKAPKTWDITPGVSQEGFYNNLL